MTAISDRVALKALAITTLNADFATQASNPDLSNVKAFWDDPGQDPANEVVVLGEITGTTEVQTFGDVGTQDDYTIKCYVQAVSGSTAQQACARAQLILNQINKSLFQSVAGTYFGKPLNSRAYPGVQNGPNGVDAMDGQPAKAFVELDVNATCNPR